MQCIWRASPSAHSTSRTCCSPVRWPGQPPTGQPPHRPAPAQASPPASPLPAPLPPHRPQHARIPPTRVAPRPGKDTFRLSSAGLLDLIRPAPRNGPMLQADDLLALARLLVNLACTSPTAAVPQSLQKSLGYIQATFSPELSQLLLLLLSPQATIHDAVAMTSGRMMTRMSQTQAFADALLGELAKECDNGRLLRLLVKMLHVADRPSLGMDEGWGAHSDRHLLRLYRDSVFHQSDENGNAVLNFAQTVHSLNKLDLGHEGKTILSSPGRQDGALLLVSCRDVREVLERSFEELAASAQSGGES